MLVGTPVAKGLLTILEIFCTNLGVKALINTATLVFYIEMRNESKPPCIKLDFSILYIIIRHSFYVI